MKVYTTRENIILEKSGSRLVVNKENGAIRLPKETELIPNDFIDYGEAVGLVGKIVVEGNVYLLVTTNSSVVGHFHNGETKQSIQRIDRVSVIPFPLTVDLQSLLLLNDGQANKFKQGTDKLFKFVQEKITPPSTALDEVLRLFNDYPDFYFCFDRDITHTTQRHFSGSCRSDPRFYWNRLLLEDIEKLALDDNEKSIWIVPVVQGFVGSSELTLVDEPGLAQTNTKLQLTLISRRSVHRAGARYLRRGIDEDAQVANFVETELILNIFHHNLSFVQLRGSVPLFWSQKGLKYRPPLTIDKTLDEAHPFFARHISKIVEDYGTPIIAVNLVDHAGRELKLAQAYLEHALNYGKDGKDKLIYVSFDLHKHCRGLRFDKINHLIENIATPLGDLGYCWVDKTGELVLRQKGIVRTNCVDCLDRTNVVQGTISQWVCMRQAQRLGIFGPLSDAPPPLVAALQTLWADNGDAISTQYAGTKALKGDVTRCGERKLTGIMRDGYHSASRYYLSHARDSQRQKSINLLLGLPDKGSESMLESSDSDDEDENVGRLVSETVHFLLPESEILVGGWGLVDWQSGNEAVNTVLLLTRTKLCVADYDDDAEKLEDVRMTPIEDIKSIEIGRFTRNSRVHIRVVADETMGAWRAAKTRLFNNVALRLKTPEEADEYVESIAEQIRVTYHMATGNQLELVYPQRLVGGQSTARKALASMSSMLKSRIRPSRSTPALKEPSTNVPDSSRAVVTPSCEEPSLIDFSGVDESGKLSGSSASDVSTKDDALALATTERESSTRGGLVGRLKNLRSQLRPGGGGIATAPTEEREAIRNPFETQLAAIPRSSTKIVML